MCKEYKAEMNISPDTTLYYDGIRRDQEIDLMGGAKKGKKRGRKPSRQNSKTRRAAKKAFNMTPDQVEQMTEEIAQGNNIKGVGPIAFKELSLRNTDMRENESMFDQFARSITSRQMI